MRRRVRMLVGAGMTAVLLVAAAGTAAEGAEGSPEDFPITGPSASGPDQVPAVAWNGIANEYLVVWQDGRDWTRGSDIYGQRVSAAGSRIGSNFLISGPAATKNDLDPAVAWNGTANEYLVVWEDGRNSATRGYDIYGQRVSATGSPVGSNFRIAGLGATFDERSPAVAWNGTANQYLIVWEDQRNDPTRGSDIYGQRVSAGGTRVGGDVRISGPGATSGESSPAVAWNGTGNEYLVAWADGRNHLTRDVDIYGQRVSATGSRVESNFRVSGPGATSDDLSPAVAWNGRANEYLIVWEDERNEATRGADIQGQLVSATGFLLGSNFRVGGSGATSDDWYPAVAWNDTTRQYLIVWEDRRDEATRGVDIYGQRVSATGSRVGPDFLVSGPGATSDDQYPAVAWNGTANQHLAVWMDGRNYATRYSDVYGQRVAG